MDLVIEFHYEDGDVGAHFLNAELGFDVLFGKGKTQEGQTLMPRSLSDAITAVWNEHSTKREPLERIVIRPETKEEKVNA